MGLNIQRVLSGANERTRGNSGQSPVSSRSFGSFFRAMPRADTKRKALESGAEALFTKPIDFLMLCNEIEIRVERVA